MGNLAPDSGILSEDGSCYVPDAAVSHFRSLDENGIKDIHEELFVEQYFSKETRKGYSEREDAFYLGYLVHLLTDKLWVNEIVYAAKKKFSELFEQDRDGLWKSSETSFRSSFKRPAPNFPCL